MIAILEDKKGFRRIENMPMYLPEYTVAEFEGFGMIATEGELIDKPIMGKQTVFRFYKESTVWGEKIIWYKEQ